MNAFALEAEGISKFFPGVKALDNVSLRVRPGTVHALMGENGAGKSTLLKSLFGLVSIRKGTVTLDGQDVTGLKTNELVRAGVGFVPQSNNVFPSLSIEENLQMGLFLKPKEFSERVEEMWELTGEAAKTGTMAMQQPWPEYDESKTVASHVEMAVQVLGKLKGTINVPVDSEQDFVVETAKQNEKVARAIDGKSIVKVILVRNKLVNLIVK